MAGSDGRGQAGWLKMNFKVYWNSLKRKTQKFLGQCHLYYYPCALTVETGNICNLQCPLCPTGQNRTDERKGFLSLEIYKKVIDELGDYLTCIYLFNWGEPLLNKDLVKFIRYTKLKKKSITVMTSSNLNTLTKDLAYDLVDSGLDVLIVSCAGASPGTYNLYHRGGDFNKVMDNMKLMVNLKNQLSKKNFQILWRFLVFRHNEEEIELSKRMAQEIGVEIELSKMRTDMAREILEPVEKAIERDGKWIPHNPRYSAYDFKNKRRAKPVKTCWKPWNEFTVNWDGKIVPCCLIYEIEKYNFGNILESPFKDIWNSPKYIAARKELLGKKNNIDTICHICKKNGFAHMP